MNIRQAIGISTLLCASVAWWPAAGATLPEVTAARQPLAFPISAGSSDGQVPSVECLVNFGPALAISALAFSPDGKTLAVGGYREVLLWDLAGAKLAKRVGAGELAGLVHAVEFVQGARTLAVGDGVPHQSGAVKLFNVETGELSATFPEPKKIVFCLAVSPKGKFLAAGSADSLVYVWDLATKKLAKTIEGHNGWVLGLSFSADGQRLATAGADQTLRVWNVDTWKSLIRYDLLAKVHGVALSPDGKIVVGAVGGPGEWALRIGRIDSDLKLAARRRPRARAVSTGIGMPLDIVWPAKAAGVFVSCNDHTVRAYRGTGARPIRTFKGHTDWVYCVASTPDGSRMASGSADGTVKLWNVADGKLLATLVQLAVGTDQWLIMTRSGYFATSSPEALAWKTAGSPAPAKKFTDRYQNAKRVLEAITPTSGKRPARQRKGKTTTRRPSAPRKRPAKKGK